VLSRPSAVTPRFAPRSSVFGPATRGRNFAPKRSPPTPRSARTIVIVGRRVRRVPRWGPAGQRDTDSDDEFSQGSRGAGELVRRPAARCASSGGRGGWAQRRYRRWNFRGPPGVEGRRAGLVGAGAGGDRGMAESRAPPRPAEGGAVAHRQRRCKRSGPGVRGQPHQAQCPPGSTAVPGPAAAGRREVGRFLSRALTGVRSKRFVNRGSP